MTAVRQEVGTHAAAELARLLDAAAVGSVFLVTGKSSWDLSGASRALAPALEGRRIERFCDFSPNPDVGEVEAGAERFRASGCESVVAVGGGSAIDLAKLINTTCAHSELSAMDIITGAAEITETGVPLIAIPTTAGSGAEATHFAAVYVDGAKYSVSHSSMRPNHAILDASLTASLSPYLTAATGMDALSQAIESCWSVRSTEESRVYSQGSIKLAIASLRGAATGESGAREAMLQAAHLAGKAIDIAKTTAPHALSYALTSRFGITHGHAVALSLGPVFAHNARVSESDVIDPRGAAFVRERMEEVSRALGVAEPAMVPPALAALMDEVGLQARLRDLGVSRSNLPELASSVNEQRLANNPRLLPTPVIGAVLQSIY